MAELYPPAYARHELYEESFNALIQPKDEKFHSEACFEQTFRPFSQ